MAAHTRYPELDLLRSLAVAGMVLYHLLYDLTDYYGYDVGLFNGGWTLFERAVASLFLLLVGCSFAISWDRARRKCHGEPIDFAQDKLRRTMTSPVLSSLGSARDDKRQDQIRLRTLYPKYLRRGLALLGCALLVTLVTYAVDPATYVRFGILHLIGVSVLLLPLFAQLRVWTVLPALACLALGPVMRGFTDPTGLLEPLGITPADFLTVDYFPLLPWFGVVLLGYTAGYALYVRHGRWRRILPPAPSSSMFRFLTWPGRYALWIYLGHQPILLLILGILLGFPALR